MLETVKKKAIEVTTEKMVKGVLSAFSFIILIIAYLSQDSVRLVDPLIWFWMFICMSVVCLGLALVIFLQRPKETYDQDVQLHKDKKTGKHLCPSCRAGKTRTLLMENENGWFCEVKECRYKRYKPGKAPKLTGMHVISPGIDSRESWINRWRQ